MDVRIGSGSDHTVFLNHLGIPTVGLEFDGPYGVYHSMYDNHYWMANIGDPGFRYHRAMAQLWGVLGCGWPTRMCCRLILRSMVRRCENLSVNWSRKTPGCTASSTWRRSPAQP